MSPRTPEQNETIRQQKRMLIMETAMKLFAHEGYHSTTMSEIAKGAGISKGLTYSYFESKEELLKAIFIFGFEELDAITKLFPNGMATKKDMEAMLDYYIDAVNENGEFWKIYFSLIMQLDMFEMFGPEILELINGVVQMLANFFEKQGSKDPETEAMLFGALMDGVFMNFLMNPEFFDLKKVKPLILRKFCS